MPRYCSENALHETLYATLQQIHRTTATLGKKTTAPKNRIKIIILKTDT
jgi:hypothetical protein